MSSCEAVARGVTMWVLVVWCAVLQVSVTLVVNFVGILACPAWGTRFGSCVPHDHSAARFLLVAFPSCGPQTGACDVCGAAAVATARAAGRRGCRGEVPRKTGASAAGTGARQARRVAGRCAVRRCLWGARQAGLAAVAPGPG